MTMTETALPAIETLDTAALEVEATWRDWSELSYPEGFDFVEAPTCFECGGDTRWISGIDLADDFTDETGELALEFEQAPATWEAWRCIDPDCAQFGEEIEPLPENGIDGPMMNYSYDLPIEFPLHADAHDAAGAIADLPLCIITEGEGGGPFSDSPALALTGGGMDLSWQICQAYCRLGYLPPIVYCDLPDMGQCYAGRMGDTDRYVVAACQRSIAEARERRVNQLNWLDVSLSKFVNAPGSYAVTTPNGTRTWTADDPSHAREQHEDGFGTDDPGERIETIRKVD